VQLKKATTQGKKYTAVFYDNDRKKIKSTSFGAVGYDDFTKHKDEERKEAYLARHKKNEDWNNYMTAGSLSMHLLWSKPTLSASYNAYLKKFNLTKY
jgi:hypothetical protein